MALVQSMNARRCIIVAKMERVDIPSDKLLAFSASNSDQISGMAEEQGHGLFTYYFLKGLNERSGETTAKALYDYLKPKVQDQARRANQEQTPQLLFTSKMADAALR